MATFHRHRIYGVLGGVDLVMVEPTPEGPPRAWVLPSPCWSSGNLRILLDQQSYLLAPEVVSGRGGNDGDLRSAQADIYMVGAMLYHGRRLVGNCEASAL